jgi:hypothetical protein
MGLHEIEVVGTPLEEAIIQDCGILQARAYPWADSYGKVELDQYYRHTLYGVPDYPQW